MELPTQDAMNGISTKQPMNESTNQPINPLIPYGWLRAMLFIAFFFLILMALQWGTGELLNVIQKASTGKDESFGQMLQSNIWISVAVTSISAFLGVWVFRRYIDRQTIASLGFAWKGFAGHAWTGFFSSIAMLGIGTLVLVLMQYLSFTGIELDPVSLISGIGLMVLVAFSEELLFRGYLLNNLMQSMNKWVALAISAVLFALVHMGNPNAQQSVLPVIEIFIGGLMLGINYIYTKNLWFAIFLHFGWNFFQGPVLGYEVSGIDLKPILTQNLNGPAMWTGGAFGFEGSLLSMVVNVLLILVLVGVYERKRLGFLKQ